MTTYGLDDRMKRLLREIRGGKIHFDPVDDSEEARIELDRDIKCLIAMRDRGLIPYDQIHFQISHDSKNLRYIAAIVMGLTYEGELAADELDLTPAPESLGNLLSHYGLLACVRDFERAVASVVSDPAQAIASASSTLESVCKEILAREGAPLPNDQSIQPLIKAATRALNIAPEAAARNAR